MGPMDDNKQSPLDSLKDRMVGDLFYPRSPSSSGLAGRSQFDERSSRGARAPSSWHYEADYDAAFRLMQRASEAVDALHDRCRRLEDEAREMSERARSEASSSERVIKDWEKLATALKAHLAMGDAAHAETQAKLKAVEDRKAALEDLLKAAEERAVALEARASAAEARAEAVEKHTTREIEIATQFRDTFVQTFGQGTRLSPAAASDRTP